MDQKKVINRRDFLRLASLGATAAAFAACAPQAPSVVEPAATQAPQIIEKTTIVEVPKEVMVTPTKYSGERAYLRFLTQETDPSELQVYRRMIDDFESQNPDVRIEMDVTGPDAIYQKMAAALGAGATSLDVLQPNPALAFALAAQGLVLPIDDVVDELGGDEFFYDNSVLKFKGQRYGIPFGGGTVMMWYRKDLFEKDGIQVPTTWEEFEEVCKHFTKAFNPQSPTEYGACLSYNKEHSMEWNQQAFWYSNGAEHFDKDLNIVFNSPETEEFIDWYASLREYSPPAATGYMFADYLNTFLTGQVAITFYLGRVLGRVYANAPDLVGKLGVANYPKRKLQVTTDDPNYYIINANSKNPDAAKRWVKYTIESPLANDFLCSIPGHLPPATKKQEEWWNQDSTGCKILDENKDIKEIIGKAVPIAYNPITNSGGIIEAIKQGKETYVSTGVANPFMATAQGTNNFLSLTVQKVVVGGMTTKDALNEVTEMMEQAVEQAKVDMKWGE